jgi:hypothetical protein
MANGAGPLPERPVDYALIKNGICITAGDYRGCIKVGDRHYWLSRRREEPWYWVHSYERPGDTMVLMTTDVWDKCKEDGTYTYKEELQGWLDEEEHAWRWDGQRGRPIFLNDDFEY